MKKHKLGKRKLAKTKAIKIPEYRDIQFKKIFSLRKKFTKNNNPVLSVDVKKKENLGKLYRNGQVYCETALTCYDHDYSYLAEGIVIPHSIYDVNRNEGYVNLNCSKDTSELFYDSLLLWWKNVGSIHYKSADSILILCDAGGSNSYRHYLFKEALQNLANEIKLKIRVAHYPPYCSKYNPIEHRMFPYITKALEGILLDSPQTVKKLINERAKTKTGLKVIVNIIKKTYHIGRKVPDEFKENMKIRFDKVLGKLNYQAWPYASPKMLK
jgi:hypothetical protein